MGTIPKLSFFFFQLFISGWDGVGEWLGGLHDLSVSLGLGLIGLNGLGLGPGGLGTKGLRTGLDNHIQIQNHFITELTDKTVFPTLVC